MIKKNSLILIINIMIVLLSGCSKNNSLEYDFFSDIDNIRMDNISNVLYDDKNFYIKDNQHILAYNEQSGIVYACDDITCSHTTDECKAYIGMNSFFVFNDSLYICKNYYDKYGEIYKINSKGEEKLVFTNDLNKEIEKNSCSNKVHVLNNEYICSYSGAGAYLMDKDFNVIHTYDFCGMQTRGVIYGNKYYYTNISEILCEFDLNTKTVNELTEISSAGIFTFDIYEDILYYANKFDELVKVDLEDYSRELVCDFGEQIDCIIDGKIVSIFGDTIKIYDLLGNKIYEYDESIEYENYYATCYKNDKVYLFAKDRFVMVNIDGTDCVEKKF